jgi:hypothetical protein
LRGTNMELLETLVTHLTAAGIGAAVIWWPSRKIKRQFVAMLEAIDEGKERDKDWRFVRDDSGHPVGFRVMMGASGSSDDPAAV